MAEKKSQETEKPGDDGESAELEELRTLQELRSKAQEEVDSLRALLEKTRQGRIKLQLETQLLAAADKYFQKTLAATQARTMEFKAMTQKEADETREEVEALQKTLDQHLKKIKETFEKSTEELQLQCERERKELEESLELQENVAMLEVEEQKNCHKNKLKEFNEEALGRLKAYYEDITRDNLQLVKKLRAENERMSANNKRLKKEIEIMAAQNAKIREPLREQEALKARLKVQLRFVEKDKLVLRNLKRRNQMMEENIKNARMEVRNLEHQKKAISRSIGQLQQSLRNVQQETGGGSAAHGALLRIQATETLAQLDSSFQQIQQAQSRSTLPQGVSSAICELIQDTIIDHNKCEKDLKEELRRCVEAYNDMLVFMRHRLGELNVPHSSIKAKSIVYENAEALLNITDESFTAFETATENETVANQQSDQASVESKGNDELAVSGASTGTPPEDEHIGTKSSSHPSGWAITYPSAKGSDNIHLGQVTLRRLTGT
ncbi:growth-arrest-specific protein 8, putative [Eimeria mitis]|uniref:Growth-arrest-specific protein 8, putative n=1 Tax=Eimeria mitis TaxID=44415 RepID=U6JX49_9EIME|nr:growth-arrest-specific protein 8, putative [Eimeria mitis]CDJ30050.1 growth-arrest-specific protein 8, putative [Eimeria mitis]